MPPGMHVICPLLLFGRNCEMQVLAVVIIIIVDRKDASVHRLSN